MTAEPDDLLDIAVVGRRLRGGLLTLAAGAALGLAAAGVALLTIPKRWEGRATVLTRTAEPKTALLEQAGLSDAVSSSLLGATGSGAMETQLELLRARRMLEPVGDSLLVGVQVRTPAATPARRLLSHYAPRAPYPPRTLQGTQVSATQWRLVGDGVDTTVAAGTTVGLPFATLAVAPSAPAGFRVRLLDREDAMRRLEKRLSVERAGGEIAEVRVRWDDPEGGAALANGIVVHYLAWRQDTDRGDNRTRYAYVRTRADSVDRMLAVALDALRGLQESTGVMDPAVSGKALLETITALREQLTESSVEAEALGTLLQQVTRDTERDQGRDQGRDQARELPAFPAFLKSPAINELVTELNRLEGERIILLQTRTEQDPGVAGRSAAIRAIEAQLVPLATTYRDAVVQRRQVLAGQVDSAARQLAALPGQARRNFELARELERLSRSAALLQAQALQLQLAVMGEGGGARAVDVATPTRRPVFPKIPLLLAGGALVGFLLAAFRVLASGASRPVGVGGPSA